MITSPTPDLRSLRCQIHGEREGVAKCGGCSYFYCRECIVEHEEQMICATCLLTQQEPETDTSKRNRLKGIVRLTGSSLAVLVSWAFFILMGRLLIWIKTTFGWLESL